MVYAANASKELAINSFMLAEAHPPKETHRMLLCQRKTETFWIKQVELTVKAVQSNRGKNQIYVWIRWNRNPECAIG